MLETLLASYNDFIEISKSNPMLAGAIGLWGAGLVTWLARNIPSSIGSFIVAQLTTRMTMTNVSSSTSWDSNELQFNAFVKWVNSAGYIGWSRSFTITTDEDVEQTPVLVFGLGSHFFIYKGIFFYIFRRRLEAASSNQDKQEISVIGLTRNRQKLLDLYNAFKYVKDFKELCVRSWRKDEWIYSGFITKRSIETVAINENILSDIMDKLTFFTEHKEWYTSRGMSYKQTFLLHGLPGTGKTSLIKALASYYNRDVYTINLGLMTDTALSKAMATIRKNSIILFEDFDANKTVQKRKVKGESISSDEIEVESTEPEEYSPLTLSGLLNELDGIISLDDVIVFMTTNHIENIDKAILRKGRVNFMYEIGLLKDAEIKKQMMVYYPGKSLSNDVTYEDIAGCNLEALFLEHTDDYESFLNSLPHAIKK